MLGLNHAEDAEWLLRYACDAREFGAWQHAFPRCNQGLAVMHIVSFRASACQVAGRLRRGQARVLEVGERSMEWRREARPLERVVPDSLSMRSHSKRPNGEGGRGGG